MKRAATIEKAYFRATSQLALGSGSTQISELLNEIVGPRLCLVEVRRADGCFTFAVDADWAEMGIGLSQFDPSDDELSSLPLPRAALRAVVAGWPTDWDRIGDPRMEVHLSEDLVPHVSLLEDQPVFDLSD
ncbi:MAG: hypothetical protein ACN4GZ_18355 [Acidimicrobiales bacterium]